MTHVNPDTLEVSILAPYNNTDLFQIGELAEDAFIRFGHYREFISALVKERGVITAVIRDPERDDDIIGFLLLGFIPVGGVFIADIMAIALEEGYRFQGLGKKLLDWAFETIQKVSLSKQVKELRLTVAQDNHPAVSLFKQYGFSFDRTGHLGNYPSGITASSMKIQFIDDELEV
ncbi:GNAT family N-acetyltransferase [Myxococcota bacterium]|nr:GNAT family N-acetyltransferase [Myxococcota bacterium]MBU1537040.1 GNAT family N-acetyltransferase [Myxococcota bacterium]